MIEIKITYYPPTDSEKGPCSISEQILPKALKYMRTGTVGNVAAKLFDVLIHNSPELEEELTP